MLPGSGHRHPFQYAQHYAKLVSEFLDGQLPTPLISAGLAPPLGRTVKSTRALIRRESKDDDSIWLFSWITDGFQLDTSVNSIELSSLVGIFRFRRLEGVR